MIGMDCIKKARMDAQGLPKPQERSTGIKWALISAVVVLAATILAAGAAALIVWGGIMTFTGLGLAVGIGTMASGVMLGLSTAGMIMTAIECIKNARHHLKPQGNPLESAEIKLLNP